MGMAGWEASYFLVCCATASLSFPSQICLAVISSLYLWINITWNEAAFTLPSVAQECLMKSCFVAEFSGCVPRWTRSIFNLYIYMTLSFFITAKTETLCGRTQDILLLKGANHQFSVYDIMTKVRRFFHACLTFQFRQCTVTGGLQTRRYIPSPHK